MPVYDQADRAAERVRDDRDRRELLLMDQLRQVVDVVDHAVVRAGDPLRVAVAAQVGREDVPVVAQPLGDPVPVAAVVAAAVHEHERRRALVAPVDVVQAQALRHVELRGGTLQLDGHGRGYGRVAALGKQKRSESSWSVCGSGTASGSASSRVRSTEWQRRALSAGITARATVEAVPDPQTDRLRIRALRRRPSSDRRCARRPRR